MEITSRQFGQIEAACFALEEATEKNNTALRLVKVITDNLAEIAKTAYPLELVFEFDQPELPMVEADLLATAKRSEDGSDPSATSDKLSEIRLYGYDDIIRTEHTPDKDGILRRITAGEDVPGAELIPAGDVAKMSFKKGYAQQLETIQ